MNQNNNGTKITTTTTTTDERGIVLFAFHGSINKEIRANEEGEFHGQTNVKSNGQWSYENKRYQLQRGDVLNFWLYVQHNDFGYKLEDLRFVYPGMCVCEYECVCVSNAHVNDH